MNQLHKNCTLQTLNTPKKPGEKAADGLESKCVHPPMLGYILVKDTGGQKKVSDSLELEFMWL